MDVAQSQALPNLDKQRLNRQAKLKQSNGAKQRSPPAQLSLKASRSVDRVGNQAEVSGAEGGGQLAESPSTKSLTSKPVVVKTSNDSSG